MGLTKQYLRYGCYSVFNIVGSQKANIVILERNKTDKYCAVGACQHVFIWDTRKGEKVGTLEGDKYEVTRLAKSPDNQHLAVGYEDGSVKVFNIASGECVITFSGHKSAVTALNYSKDGMRLVSGAKDTDVIVWDIVNESGLFRLKGHKDMITQARFMSKADILITSSKDSFVKFWDLETQHCFKTILDHRTEVWDFILSVREDRLITGSSDMELRVWSITQKQDGAVPTKRPKLMFTDSTEDSDEDDDDMGILDCKLMGSLKRHGRDRVLSMQLDQTGTFLGCHGTDTHLELYKISTEDEARKRFQKRLKKARKRAKEAATKEDSDEVTPEVNIEQSLSDEMSRVTAVKMSAKIRSFTMVKEKDGKYKIVSLMSNNTIEVSMVEDKRPEPVGTRLTKIELPGHRNDVRTVCFSSDNTAVLSASGDTLKIWNRTTLQCIRTIPCDYALTSVFAPGDRHVILGTKSGKLQIFDLASGTLLEDIEAHTGAVWSICLSPDKRSIVSGSADKEVKFWDFELIADKEYSSTTKRLTLVQTRTLKMAEDVLCVKYSPDQKLLAVSLLDNTVKVFFADTLKFFLSLYGHKLPVLCMDISTDGSLLVTGSADRNCKLWGLDFGDCHKSIFAHDDSIMSVQFVPNTHMFFTGGKDRKIKQWDGDTFDHIQTLQGHCAEVWSLSVSPSGNFLVSASHDKSLRLWDKTEEPIVLDEEREMEREEEYDKSVQHEGQPVVAGESAQEAALAGKKTIETVKAAERIMEAIDLYEEETAKLKEYEAIKKSKKKAAALPTHPMFAAHKVDTPLRYMEVVLIKVRSSELEEALLVLPFNYVRNLLIILDMILQSGRIVELTCRCLFFLLRVHQGQITSNQMLLPVIDRLKKHSAERVNEIRDTIGFNIAGLQYLQQQIEAKEQVTFFADATCNMKDKKKKAKKRAILTIKT